MNGSMCISGEIDQIDGQTAPSNPRPLPLHTTLPHQSAATSWHCDSQITDPWPVDNCPPSSETSADHGGHDCFHRSSLKIHCRACAALRSISFHIWGSIPISCLVIFSFLGLCLSVSVSVSLLWIQYPHRQEKYSE